MQQLVFSNQGIMGLELVSLMGASVKESENPIGFFGTGLKYALAVILRLGGAVHIYLDGKQYQVRTEQMCLRGKYFYVVTLNKRKLGFTTELGSTCHAWQAVRELFSNALDEGGSCGILKGLPELKGNTVIAVTGSVFLDIWENRRKYFLMDEISLHENLHVNAYKAEAGNKSVFYRGIKAHETEQPTLYRYSINTFCTLTEDRTLYNPVSMRDSVERSVITSEDPCYVERLLTASKDFFEHNLPFTDSHCFSSMSNAFKETCEKLIKEMPRNTNHAALDWYRNRVKTTSPYEDAEVTPSQQQQMDRAKEFLKKINIDVQYEIHVVQWLGQDLMGVAKDGKIYLSKEIFDRGTKYVASTLLEEYVHLKYSYSDYSLSMQTYSFCSCLSTILVKEGRQDLSPAAHLLLG